MSEKLFCILAKASGHHTHDNHLTNYVCGELATKKGVLNITYKASIMVNSLLFYVAN